MHEIPEDSRTLLFPGMYANFELEQSMRDEYDTGWLVSWLFQISIVPFFLLVLLLMFLLYKQQTNKQPFYCSSGICPGPPGWAGTRKAKPRRLKPIWIYWSKRQWVAVASAGPYASPHPIPDNHANIPPLSFFTGRMPFLTPNQQRQSTEGKSIQQPVFAGGHPSSY